MDTTRFRPAVITLALFVVFAVAIPTLAFAGDTEKRNKRNQKPRENAGDVIVQLELPAAPSLGRYRGEDRLRVNRVYEGLYSDRPDDLGSVREKRGPLVFKVEGSRIETVRESLEAAFVAVGLSPVVEGAPTLDADIGILRNRLSSIPEGIRAEVFLDVWLSRDDAVVGRVLACGNAERPVKRQGRELSEAGVGVYRAAFNDALWKIFGSETFDSVLGAGWSGAEPEPDPDGTTRIDRAHAFGPTRSAVQTLPAVRRALEPFAGQGSRLAIEEFDVRDLHYLVNKRGSRQAVSRRITGRVVEHLQAYYPGALDGVKLREGWDRNGSSGVALTGTTLSFDAGGSSNRLQADVYLKDNESGVNLFTFHVDWRRTRKPSASSSEQAQELPGGTYWQDYYGESDVAQMEETLASSLAFLLVRGLRPDYTYPDSVEVRFDGIPYPFLSEDED